MDRLMRLLRMGWPISEPRKEFFYPLKYGWCANADMPEQAICFDEDTVKIEFMHVGFTDINVYPGYWSKGSEGLSYQDIIVASK